MNSTASLTGSHLRTHEMIFQHPAAHNLEWRNVRALLEKLGGVYTELNGHLKITRNGQTLVLAALRTKDVATTDELLALRHFLQRSEEASPEQLDQETHWLVVIDHHEARLYRSEMRGAVPQQILPHDPAEHFRHAHNAKDFTRGREKPEPNSFFEPIVDALKDAGKILVFGGGTGTASEREQFTAWLNHHHPELARRVIGSVVIDEHHFTEAQLLAKAREFYASLPRT